ncbi:MAG: hypothetical protein M3O01_00555 [Pseudomonadota bacterium]|nr:hypothetical protein [Pseudomonadota bacterium]
MSPTSRTFAWLPLLIAAGGGDAMAEPPLPINDAPSATASASTMPAAHPLAVDESITVVVHTAQDCPVCKAWRESPAGQATAEQLRRDWPLLKVVFIERKLLNGSETESLYPADLQPLYDARRERYQLSPPVPMFELVRQGRVISRHAGMQGWTDGTRSEIIRLEANRSSPATGPTQGAMPR